MLECFEWEGHGSFKTGVYDKINDNFVFVGK